MGKRNINAIIVVMKTTPTCIKMLSAILLFLIMKTWILFWWRSRNITGARSHTLIWHHNILDFLPDSTFRPFNLIRLSNTRSFNRAAAWAIIFRCKHYAFIIPGILMYSIQRPLVVIVYIYTVCSMPINMYSFKYEDPIRGPIWWFFYNASFVGLYIRVNILRKRNQWPFTIFFWN